MKVAPFKVECGDGLVAESEQVHMVVAGGTSNPELAFEGNDSVEQDFVYIGVNESTSATGVGAAVGEALDAHFFWFKGVPAFGGYAFQVW